MGIRWLTVAVGFGLFAAACGSDVVVNTGSGADAWPLGPVVDDTEVAGVACSQVVQGIFRQNNALTVGGLELLSTAVDPDSGLPERLLAIAGRLAEGDDDAVGDLVGSRFDDISQCIEMAEMASSFSEPERMTDALFDEALANARSSWAAAGVDTYYYEVEAHTHDVNGSEPPCGFGEPLIVEVVDGVVESARAKLSGCAIRAAGADRAPLTLTEWFDFFEAEVEEHGTSVTELMATFDADGAPIEFYAGGDQRFAEVGFREFSVGRPDTSTVDGRLTELAASRSIWASGGMNSYRMTVEIGCLCPAEMRGPFDVTIADGALVEALYQGDAASGDAFRQWFTVEGLFANIERLAQSDELTVTYDPTYGFPTFIDADPRLDTYDDETTITITSFEPTVSSPVPLAMVMPDVVGLADIDAASDAIEAACGSGTIFPEPAWDPSNPTPDEQIIHQIPAPGTPLVVNGFCTPAEGEFAGMSIAVFYTNPTYCSGPEDSIGLGWCPRQSPSTESVEPVPAASVTTTAPVTTQAPPTTSPPPSNDLAMVMPNLIGLPNFDSVGSALIAACGSSVFFPEPGWDPANPVQSGQVIHQLPAPGTPLILDDTNPGFVFCTTSDGPYAGSTLTAFGADPIYCVGPEDAIGFGWCPVQSPSPTIPAATTSTTVTPDG